MENKKINIIALGSDPEFFIRDVKNEIYVPSVGLIGGTKEEPRAISEDGHYVQEDNVMVEVNLPPCIDPERFQMNLDYILNNLNRHLEDNINPNYEIRIVASADFTLDQLNTEQAQTVGCEPDRNAWFDMDNPSPILPETVRFAGGHIHISYDKPDMQTNIEIVKAMDMFLGLPSVIMDDDDRRKEIYGTPGRYRNKKYGVEYRSLSNYWLSSFEKVQWVFNQVNKAIEFLNNGNTVDNIVPVIIDTDNKEKALEFVKKNNIDILEPKKEFIKESINL